ATAGPGDGTLARSGTDRFHLRALRAGRDRKARGIAAGVPGGALRGQPGAWLDGSANRRAGPDGSRPSAEGAPSRSAHARPLPRRPASRSPRDLPPTPPHAHGRARPGTVVGPARTACGHPAPRPATRTGAGPPRGAADPPPRHRALRLAADSAG